MLTYSLYWIACTALVMGEYLGENSTVIWGESVKTNPSEEATRHIHTTGLSYHIAGMFLVKQTN